MKRVSFLRSILITDPLIALATILYGTASFLASFFDPTKRKQNAIERAWGRALLAVSGVRVKVDGLEKIKEDGSYVFVSNHLSYMDTPVALASIPVRFRFLAKRGLFQIPFMGWHLARAGHIRVPREDARAAVKTMTLAAQVVRDEGISLLIFPEGGRSRTGSMRDFKEGAAFIAIKAGVPLVPVALKGTREILPFGSGHVRSGTVTMRIGHPIPTDRAKAHDRMRLTEELRHRIVSMLEDQPIHA
ncbi:MAG TPA: lysophospholipid acyltransferase family protein [Bryobacteraceae bacterium]|nr:lysophospholipid acyltransferase family protein [Bryobacteraceae bacterium]